jgi:xylulose-5-phosphate/fructose-6-phosphate phosphoketolase
VTNRQWDAATEAHDVSLARMGRVLEMLSEHQCEGWLEGYLLTGRHGLFNCYEAFIHIIDSMFNQHAKWLKVMARLPGESVKPAQPTGASAHFASTADL